MKKDAVNRTLEPPTPDESERQKSETIQFNNENQTKLNNEKIRKILYFLSKDKSLSYDTCSMYFESHIVIVNGLSSYGVIFVKLKGIRKTLNLLIQKKDTGQKEFDKLYDDFNKIYTGEMYLDLIKGTILENKIDKTQSFRINLLTLCTKALKYIVTTVKTRIKWEATIYENYTEYYTARLKSLKTAYPTMSIFPTFDQAWPKTNKRNWGRYQLFK